MMNVQTQPVRALVQACPFTRAFAGEPARMLPHHPIARACRSAASPAQRMPRCMEFALASPHRLGAQGSALPTHTRRRRRRRSRPPRPPRRARNPPARYHHGFGEKSCRSRPETSWPCGRLPGPKRALRQHLDVVDALHECQDRLGRLCLAPR